MQRRWDNYHKKCKKVYSNIITLNDHDITRVKQLHTDGATTLAKLDCRIFSSEINSRFESMKDGNSHLSVQLPRDPTVLEFVPQIFNILQKVSPLVEAYFGSYFQPYFITIERNQPAQTTADTSFGWHIDDNPRQIMKIFIYLNDVYRDNGAFRAFSYKHSYQILKKGFISYSEKTRTKNQAIVNDYYNFNQDSLTVFEGDAGTVLMFDNNIVHKGTAPIIGDRQFVQIEIFPSLKKITEQQVANALTRPIVRDYPIDPHCNDMTD